MACVGGRGYGEREAWLEMKGEGACDKARGRCRRKCCVRARNQTLCSGVVTFAAPSFPEQPPFAQLRGVYGPRGAIVVVLDAGVNEMKEKRQAVSHKVALGVFGVEIRLATPTINHTSKSRFMGGKRT